MAHYRRFNSITRILMNRDGMTPDDASDEVLDFKEWFDEAAERGASLMEIEDEFESRFGLEPDYLEEFIYVV